jgi:hypothetical protein
MRVYAFFMPRAASMIFRLRLNEMDLQPSRQMLALLQCQLDHPRRVFGHGRVIADLIKAKRSSGPTNSNVARHLIPHSRLQRPGAPIGRPSFRTVSVLFAGHSNDDVRQ